MEYLSVGYEEIEKALPSGSSSGGAENTSAVVNLKRLMEEVHVSLFFSNKLIFFFNFKFFINYFTVLKKLSIK